MMKYKLKESAPGKVTYIYNEGTYFVRGDMSLENAEKFMTVGKVTESDFEGFPICVDDDFYFEGTPVKTRKAKKKEAEE